MTPIAPVRPNASQSWTVNGNAAEGLSLQTEGRNWINGVIIAGHSATSTVSLHVNGDLVTQATVSGNQTWSPALAVPHPLPVDALIAVTSNSGSLVYVTIFGFAA